MPIPKHSECFLPLLRLSSKHESLHIRDAVTFLCDEFGLTEEERSQMIPSGNNTVIHNRVSWAKTYLTHAGLLQRIARGSFCITDSGKNFLAKNPTCITEQSLAEYSPKFRAFIGKSQSPRHGKEERTEKPKESILASMDKIEKDLGEELLSRIESLPFNFFEKLIVTLLLAMGYGGSVENAGKALGRSGDGGIDGFIDQDALGIDRIYVQAKRYNRNTKVGPDAIRDFFGSLDRFKAHKGLFVTTSDFTSASIETAESLSKRIVLINGTQLVKLMIRYNIGCRIQETLFIKKLDEDFFDY